MTILKLKIDNTNFEIECKKGEEEILREAEELINLKFKDNPHLEQLSQSKKFLMISLLLAGDLSILQNELLKKIDDEDYKKILEDLDILEKII